jgi:DNA-binding NarL/FixJ family response regulator
MKSPPFVGTVATTAKSQTLTSTPNSSLRLCASLLRARALLAPAITRRLIEQFVHRPPPGAQKPPELAEVTERELDVLRLVARGLSNAEIATSLSVSEATVKTHVTHILTKLNLRDRVQAVVLAYESGLIQPGDRDASQPTL